MERNVTQTQQFAFPNPQSLFPNPCISWEPAGQSLRTLNTETSSTPLFAMKKVIIIALVVLLAAGGVFAMIYKAQSGYTKVLTGKVVRQDLSTVVSGTGQIKPKTYVNVGATSFGRITHLLVKEGDHVSKGQVLARVEDVQAGANVDAQQALISSSKTVL